MTQIYVDTGAALLPDASEQLAHLLDAGHRVVLIARAAADRDRARRSDDSPMEARPDAEAIGLRWSERRKTLPKDVPRGSWLVTTEPSRCVDRPPGVVTVLIGPTVTEGPRPTLRCDVLARDVRSAVLEILARDVMP